MRTLFVALSALLLLACGAPTTDNAEQPGEVNVYTHRHYDADKELYARFTEATGIRVNIIQAGDDELLARLEQEGPRSPCDVFITADAGRLGLAKARGLLQAIESPVLKANIPAHLRDAEDHWFGLTMRARLLAYNKEKVDPNSLRTYQDLTLPEWKGRVLVRSAENVYNQSLMASMIAHDGPAIAEAWAKGLVANMARTPKGGDTDQLLAIGEDIGDVALVNSYYVGKLLSSDEPEKQKAKALLGVCFPVNGAHGTHVNVSGAGVARHAPNKAAAMALLEFLSGDDAQRVFAEANKEYPVKPGISPSGTLAAWGAFVPDTLDLALLAKFNAEATKRMDAAGWR